MTLPKRIPRKSDKAERGKRSPAHRAWVRGHECAVPGCEGRPIECAHVRNGTNGGTGIKPGDEWSWSACQAHHAEQHRLGEPSFEAKYGLDLKALAAEFFAKSPHRQKLERAGG